MATQEEAKAKETAGVADVTIAKKAAKTRFDEFAKDLADYGPEVAMRMAQVYGCRYASPQTPMNVMAQMIWQQCAAKGCEPASPADFIAPPDPKKNPCGGSPYFKRLNEELRRTKGRTSALKSSPFHAMTQLDLKARSFAELEYFDQTSKVIDEKSERIADPDRFALLCLIDPKHPCVISPDYGAPGTYRVRAKTKPSDPNRKEYVFHADKPTRVPAVFAFTILNQHRGIVGEWEFEAPPGYGDDRVAKEKNITG